MLGGEQKTKCKSTILWTERQICGAEVHSKMTDRFTIAVMNEPIHINDNCVVRENNFQYANRNRRRHRN